MILRTHNNDTDDSKSCVILPPVTLIRPWLHHSLVEMFKNAMVASMEARVPHQQQGLHSFDDPPPIEVSLNVIRGDDDMTSATTPPAGQFVSIHIRDFGRGLAPGIDPFQFASSPQSETKWDRLQVQQSYATVRSPLSSLGVGVPSSQWLLQHFGGNLELQTNTDRGGGCTATLTLPLDDTVPEYLPME